MDKPKNCLRCGTAHMTVAEYQGEEFPPWCDQCIRLTPIALRQAAQEEAGLIYIMTRQRDRYRCRRVVFDGPEWVRLREPFGYYMGKRYAIDAFVSLRVDELSSITWREAGGTEQCPS